ncbi:MAG TPA: hypothetical protein VJN18_24715 [Polyangiaceae bacterium]|nr:hypothetical protein [Polyangiaceae bacterium]
MASTRDRYMLLLLASASAGCAVGLSSNQPAHVAKPGQLHAEIGVDVSYPTGTAQEVIDAADSVEEAVRQQQQMPSDAQKRVIFEGGAAIAMNPPAAVPHLGVDYGVAEKWEVGARLATSGWRLSARRQLLTQEAHGIDLSAGLGAGRALLTPPVQRVFESLEVSDFWRWNVDLPVALGRHGSWYRVWGGPRLLYSWVSQTMTLTLDDLGTAEPVRASGKFSGRGLYAGAYAGAALGYRSLFIGPELTLVYLFGSADVDSLGSRQNVAVESLVVYPAFAVMGEF